MDRLIPAREERLLEALRMIAPGTLLRQAIDNIVRARTGALLVFADEEKIRPLISGGIDIDVALKPMVLYELAKMDGAILLDRAGTHILHANVQLMPDARIDSQETGTRHRTAERVAKQLDTLAISISAARDVVTVYLGEIRYIMDPIRVLLAKADQALETLERFRSRFNEVVRTLSTLEFQHGVTLMDVITVLQRTEMVLALSRLIERYIVELGTEGRLVALQLGELLFNVRETQLAVLMDYLPDNSPEKIQEVLKALSGLSSEELLSPEVIARILGYPDDPNVIETRVEPRGYRMLGKILRAGDRTIEELVQRFGTFEALISAPVEDLASVSNMGMARAREIKEGLIRLRQRDLLERYG